MIGHQFLGLCLVSVQDLISCRRQTHVVSLQGRPFSSEDETRGTLSLQVSILFPRNDCIHFHYVTYICSFIFVEETPLKHTGTWD